MIAVEERIRELRERAKRLREAAQHADSRQAYSEDMQAAAKAEDEADELSAQLHDNQHTDSPL